MGFCGGCAWLDFSRSADRLREDLIGREVSVLRGCAPVPSIESVEDGQSRLRFFWLDARTVISRGADEWPPASVRDVPEEAPAVRSERDLQAYCLMIVDVAEDARIRAVEVDGRDPRGLRAADECMIQIGRCLTSRGKLSRRP